MSGAPPKAIRAALLVTPSGVVAPCWRLMLPIAPKSRAAVGARLSATVQRSGRLIFGQSRYQAVIAQSPIDSPTVRSCVEALLRADSYSAPCSRRGANLCRRLTATASVPISEPRWHRKSRSVWAVPYRAQPSNSIRIRNEMQPMGAVYRLAQAGLALAGYCLMQDQCPPGIGAVTYRCSAGGNPVP